MVCLIQIIIVGLGHLVGFMLILMENVLLCLSRDRTSVGVLFSTLYTQSQLLKDLIQNPDLKCECIDYNSEDKIVDNGYLQRLPNPYCFSDIDMGHSRHHIFHIPF